MSPEYTAKLEKKLLELEQRNLTLEADNAILVSLFARVQSQEISWPDALEEAQLYGIPIPLNESSSFVCH